MSLYEPSNSLSIAQMHLFRYRTTGQTYLQGNDQVVFNTADYGSTYLSGGAYVAPEDGIYHFDAGGTCRTTTGNAYLQIKVDGVLVAQSPVFTNVDSNTTLSCETYVAKNSAVALYITWSGTAGFAATDSTNTFLMGNMVVGGNADAGVVDTTPPAISGYAIVGMSDRGDGTFTFQAGWTTGEPASTQVEWTQDGGTTTYTTPLDDTLVTSHLVTLGPDYPVAGDIDVTVKSTDASGNLATEVEPTATVA